jgi:hypothetical protein
LTPPDPQLKGAWYPGGFNPCTYQVKKTVSKRAFHQMQLAPLRRDSRKKGKRRRVGRGDHVRSFRQGLTIVHFMSLN